MQKILKSDNRSKIQRKNNKKKTRKAIQREFRCNLLVLIINHF